MTAQHGRESVSAVQGQARTDPLPGRLWLTSLVGETDNPVGEPRSAAEAGIGVGSCWPRAAAGVGQLEDLGCSALVGGLQGQLGRAFVHGALADGGGQLPPLFRAGQGLRAAVGGGGQPEKRPGHA